jgi:hypothetical protein
MKKEDPPFEFKINIYPKKVKKLRTNQKKEN